MSRFTSKLIWATFALAAPAAAWSDTLNLSYDTAWDGSEWVTSGPGTINAPTVPSSLTYGNSFSAPSVVLPNPSPTGWAFYDDYIFTVTPSSGNSITTTIDLGNLQVSNLGERLFSYSGSGIPTTGVPAGGAIVAWQYPIGDVGTVTVLPATTLAPGTYVLQIDGNVTGPSGGSYAGTLNLDAVPEPASAWMLGFGLMAVATAVRLGRRST
ncbi:MAG: FxDxF family PEP-CTERM protein [Thiobacillaceae bacterium]